MIASSPLPAGAGCCLLIANFLTPAECRALIAGSEARGYASAATDYPPSYRNNHRHVIDADDLAASLGARVQAHAPPRIDADGREWRFDSINARLRFCRNTAGQRFSIHQDGVHHRGADCRSHLTVLLYLTDGAGFDGGDTVFYAHGPSGAGAPIELGRVRPTAGSLLLFDHALWHAGAEVSGGVKHVLRSDVLYRATAPAAHVAEPGAHQGYVWSLAALDDRHIASGGRDATIRIQDAAGHPLRELHGHAQSVLGLAPLPGQHLASVSRDRTLRVWNWATGACGMTVAAHDTVVLDVTATPDGTLATAGADGLVKLWRQDGSALGTLAGHDGWVWQLAALDASHIASASEDGNVRIWDTAAMRCIAVLGGDQPLRTLLALDGAIWTGDIAGRITCWSPAPERWRQSAQLTAHRAAIRRLRHAGAGLVASCGEDCAMRLWTAAGRAMVLETWHANFVTDALRCGATMVSSSYDGKILRHDVPV
jgi:hypothetical protein